MSKTKNQKLVDQYLKDIQLGKHGERQVNCKSRLNRITSTLNIFIKKYFNDKCLDKITQSDLEDFFLRYKNNEIKRERVIDGNNIKTDYAKRTLIDNWKIWRKFYSYVNGWDTLEMPIWLRKMKITGKVEKPLDRNEYATKEKMEMIVEHMRDSTKRMVLKTLFDFGISYGELMDLKLKNVYFDAEKGYYFISIKEGWKDARKPREISYNWYEADFIIYLRNHPEWDYIHKKPKDKECNLFPKTSVVSFNKLLSRISKKLFKERWTSHWMRRGLITHLFDNDIPDGVIKYRVGLAENTRVLSHYNQRSKKRDDTLKQALNRSTTDKLKFENEKKMHEQEKNQKLIFKQMEDMQGKMIEMLKENSELKRTMQELKQEKGTS